MNKKYHIPQFRGHFMTRRLTLLFLLAATLALPAHLRAAEQQPILQVLHGTWHYEDQYTYVFNLKNNTVIFRKGSIQHKGTVQVTMVGQNDVAGLILSFQSGKSIPLVAVRQSNDEIVMVKSNSGSPSWDVLRRSSVTGNRAQPENPTCSPSEVGLAIKANLPGKWIPIACYIAHNVRIGNDSALQKITGSSMTTQAMKFFWDNVDEPSKRKFIARRHPIRSDRFIFSDESGMAICDAIFRSGKWALESCVVNDGY